MDRRKFIERSAWVGAGVSIAGSSVFANDSIQEDDGLVILHTNDVHSHIDPFPIGHSRNPNQGGVERRAALIDQIRKTNKNVLLFDCGDIFQGTPYFNMYGGELEFKLMSQMRYDASTLGNHDFDNGLKGLEVVWDHAKFPFLNCNYDFKNTQFDGRIAPHKIFKRGPWKVGVFGVGIELDGLVSSDLYGEVVYHDPIERAQEAVSQLKEEGCNLIVCLSHLGQSYDSDKIDDLKLANRLKDVDIILGGHTHTFMTEPIQVEQDNGSKVLVSQAGWAGLILGKIEVKKVNDLTSNSIIGEALSVL